MGWQAARDDLEAARKHWPKDAEVLHHLALWHLSEAQHLSEGSHTANPAIDDAADAHRKQAIALSREMLAAGPNDADRRLKHLRILMHPQIHATEQAKPLAKRLTEQLAANPHSAHAVAVLADLWPHIDQQRIDSPTTKPAATEPAPAALAPFDHALPLTHGLLRAAICFKRQSRPGRTMWRCARDWRGIRH